MPKTLKPKKKEIKRNIIGYNCSVCRGRNIIETNSEIVHICEGILIPVFKGQKQTKLK